MLYIYIYKGISTKEYHQKIDARVHLANSPIHAILFLKKLLKFSVKKLFFFHDLINKVY